MIKIIKIKKLKIKVLYTKNEIFFEFDNIHQNVSNQSRRRNGKSKCLNSWKMLFCFQIQFLFNEETTKKLRLHERTNWSLRKKD